jgi:hypothetical protein
VTKREGFVDSVELGIAQPELARPRVFGGVLGAGSLGDRKERGPPRQKPERNLAHGRIMRAGS